MKIIIGIVSVGLISLAVYCTSLIIGVGFEITIASRSAWENLPHVCKYGSPTYEFWGLCPLFALPLLVGIVAGIGLVSYLGWTIVFCYHRYRNNSSLLNNV